MLWIKLAEDGRERQWVFSDDSPVFNRQDMATRSWRVSSDLTDDAGGSPQRRSFPERGIECDFSEDDVLQAAAVLCLSSRSLGQIRCVWSAGWVAYGRLAHANTQGAQATSKISLVDASCWGISRCAVAELQSMSPGSHSEGGNGELQRATCSPGIGRLGMITAKTGRAGRAVTGRIGTD